ncbi:pr70.5 [rat cytomegalovirus strain Maastricht]|uniref:Pr70.5 n=1 Tax=Rat cytomegalovirus (strain Maastricht) TaxID=79700 RepID=Q9DWC9_RCMVM|nr:pr70.5 [rat cytomegalovirus strain Maastricht]AAF99161.1 pr70.5 [rat cytomegalovirus strain Maastricht]WEG71991.1 membrane protein m71.4 [Murid betaherpesvirus 2]
MTFAGGGWISVCVYVFWIAGARCARAAEKCEDVQFVVAGFRERSGNQTTVVFRTESTTMLASLVEQCVVSPYSWVNVSQCEAERRLALSQVETLARMVSAFPRNVSFMLWYTVSAWASAAIVAVDSTVVTFDGNFSSAMTNEDVQVDTEQFKMYAGRENFTEFLRSKDAVLKRWRENCQGTVDRDKADSANVTFSYHSDTKEFECSVDKTVPVDYLLALECGKTASNQRMPKVTVGNVTRQTMSWTDPDCDASVAKCVVQSGNGWEKKVGAIVISSGSSGTAGLAAANGAGAAAAVVVVVLVLGLFLIALFRYKGRRRPISGIRGLVRERVGCARLIV